MSWRRDEVGLTVGDRYKTVGVLGEGGMGVVYDAIDLETGKAVAVKVLFAERMNNPSAFRRFKREARVIAQLEVPQVCRLFDVGILKTGEPFFVMERLEGETLRVKLNREGRFSFDECLWIISEILTALGAAHSQGVVHRDIKPENVVISEDEPGRPSIKLIDFGVAKLRKHGRDEESEESTANVTLTKAGTVIGTMWYLSPEQARGEEVDPTSDVWSTGVLFYEMLTGVKPFDSERVVTLIGKIVRNIHELPSRHRPDMPAWIESLVERAIVLDRKKRFADANVFRDALVHDWHESEEPMESVEVLIDSSPISSFNLPPPHLEGALTEERSAFDEVKWLTDLVGDTTMAAERQTAGHYDPLPFVDAGDSADDTLSSNVPILSHIEPPNGDAPHGDTTLTAVPVLHDDASLEEEEPLDKTTRWRSSGAIPATEKVDVSADEEESRRGADDKKKRK